MDEAELRARIRELLHSGALPRSLPPLTRLETGRPVADADQSQVGRAIGATCLACGEATPTFTYRYPNGLVVRMHEGCDAMWREERERPTPRPS